jgi:hypothetical protein
MEAVRAPRFGGVLGESESESESESERDGNHSEIVYAS